MRIHFDSDQAWTFLKSHGFVFTLRKFFPTESKVDYDVEIIRKGRVVAKGRKVHIDVIEYLPELGPFVDASGFKEIDEWWAEAERLCGKRDLWDLYYVHLVKR